MLIVNLNVFWVYTMKVGGNMSTVKEKTVEILINNKGNYISGEALAEKLGVSRAAVWKAVSSLKEDGFNIDAVTNKGYMLNGNNDVLSSVGIARYLDNEAKKCRIIAKNTVSSTNIVAREMAASGEDELLVVVSKEQTAGKGRMGRSFFSPDGTGLYLSIILRPDFSPEKSMLITTAAAVAACEALEKLGCENPQIKWVNDVFVNGKKVAGILTEASVGLETGKLDYAVLGIGINLYKPHGGFPDNIKDIAGAAFKAEIDDVRNKLAAYFLNSFIGYYGFLPENSYSDEYIRRSFVIGKDITIIDGEKRERATVLGIDNECRLIVRLYNGSEKHLSSGEISIRVVAD